MVEKGQFAMNKMKAWQGSYGVSNYTGIVSPAYYVFKLKKVEPSFFHIAIRSKSTYVPFFIQASDGVRIGQWDLSKPRMKEIPFYIPPKDCNDLFKSYSYSYSDTLKLEEHMVDNNTIMLKAKGTGNITIVTDNKEEFTVNVY
jgi:type I restriction enzyme S subunit